MKKKALITGITGQDGSYLAELLLKKGYSLILKLVFAIKEKIKSNVLQKDLQLKRLYLKRYHKKIN